MTLSIRAACDEDAEGLIALIGSCFSEYEGCVLDVDGELPELRHIASYFSSQKGAFWVAIDRGVLVGCIGYSPGINRQTIELRKLYVHASYRKAGLGARLCALVEQAAREQKADFIELWSDTRFVTAHNFYRRRGYEQGEQTRALYDKSHTIEYYFLRRLDPILASILDQSDGQSPSKIMLLCHGILGAGANLRSLARKIVRAKPDWAAVIVDLRLHGASQNFAPPHSIEACVADLERLCELLPLPVRAILGHSFGGKVAMRFTETHRPSLEQLFVLDASPSRDSGGTRLGSQDASVVIELLRRMPRVFPSKQAVTESIVASGVPLPIAQWLTMNWVRVGEHVELRLDLDGVQQLLSSYFSTDGWSVMNKADVRQRWILGGTSPALSMSDRERLKQNVPSNSSVHVLEGVGHWVHIEAGEQVFSIVQDTL